MSPCNFPLKYLRFTTFLRSQHIRFLILLLLAIYITLSFFVTFSKVYFGSSSCWLITNSVSELSNIKNIKYSEIFYTFTSLGTNVCSPLTKASPRMFIPGCQFGLQYPTFGTIFVTGWLLCPHFHCRYFIIWKSLLVFSFQFLKQFHTWRKKTCVCPNHTLSRSWEW